MEADIIEGVDEDGNSVLLEVIRYFFYNGEEYVVLAEADESGDDCGCGCSEQEEEEACGCGCGCGDDSDDCEDDNELTLYIMKVVELEDEDGEAMEEFLPIEDEDLLEQLIAVVKADLDEDDELDD